MHGNRFLRVGQSGEEPFDSFDSTPFHHKTRVSLVTRDQSAASSSLLIPSTLFGHFCSSQHMRRRAPHDEEKMADYVPVSQDAENPSPTNSRKGTSILPRSYNARRRLTLLAICALVGLGLLAAVHFFQSGNESIEEGTIVGGICS